MDLHDTLWLALCLPRRNMVVSAGGNKHLGGGRLKPGRDIGLLKFYKFSSICTKEKFLGWLEFFLASSLSSYHVGSMPFDKRDLVRSMKL